MSNDIADHPVGTRSRTRSAILEAAARSLAHDWAATMPEIAEAAGVGRTTLHRYFPDRETLIHATTSDSLEIVQASIDDAGLEDGPPIDAMRRAVAAMVAVGDRLLYLFGDPRVLASYSETGVWMPTEEDPLLRLIERGQADGAFDTEVSACWIQHSLWALVGRGCADAAEGLVPRHGVAALVIRTFENGIRCR
ncbi:TetR/AcrR family transcriptional regulator [Plantibacter sp. YIM 135249]|uniref:TetR/AcrR family transcriptional regulator n=1 Tax=Plantibacter sp. YIM 135249 TaxID=3423918 RepID=UPI003D351589